MATIEACSPVHVENVSTSKRIELPLVSYSKRNSIVVQMNKENVTLTFDTLTEHYKIRYNGHDYRCDGPTFRPVFD